MPKRTTKTKKPGIRKAHVLGLRATPEQRAWLNMRAAERQLSLQGLFEEMMLQQPGSPWLPKTDTLISVPIEEKELMTRITAIVRMRSKRPDVLNLFDLVVRQTEISVSR